MSRRINNRRVVPYDRLVTFPLTFRAVDQRSKFSIKLGKRCPQSFARVDGVICLELSEITINTGLLHSACFAGIVGAAGEAMLKLAKLCETLATSVDGILESPGWGEARGREKLAALSVKRYLSAMAAG